MTRTRFPAIDEDAIANTRGALHGYAKILGHCLKASRPKRKHWWHASLLRARTASGEAYDEPLKGQPVYQLADTVIDFLVATGAKRSLAADLKLDRDTASQFDAYSDEQANLIGRVFGDVAALLAEFRAEITEEPSPIQVWPHHFDISLLWLPGEKIRDQDPSSLPGLNCRLEFIGKPRHSTARYSPIRRCCKATIRKRYCSTGGA